MADMQPQIGESVVQIPITFDYQGGRGENKKTTIISSCIFGGLTILGIAVSIWKIPLELYIKILICLGELWVGICLIRYVCLNEAYYSDIYEEMLKRDLKINLEDYWQIFKISNEYPYMVYFKNGMKALFIRMERDTAVGKGDYATYTYNHFEAIADGLNLAFNNKVDVMHLDLMGSMGYDSRVVHLKEHAKQCENDTLGDALYGLYSYLEQLLQESYDCQDIYVFFSRQPEATFIKNVNNVLDTFVGYNYIAYSYLNSKEISRLTLELFGLHDFDYSGAINKQVSDQLHPGIRPLYVVYADGNVKHINDSKAVEKQKAELDAKNKLSRKQIRKQKQLEKKKVDLTQTDEFNLFDAVDNSSENDIISSGETVTTPQEEKVVTDDIENLFDDADEDDNIF